jgi:hypothetical protein
MLLSMQERSFCSSDRWVKKTPPERSKQRLPAGGYLESMYAGVGGEWLYRPFASPVVLGVDMNVVRMRDFRQDFALQKYQVATGHVWWHDLACYVTLGMIKAVSDESLRRALAVNATIPPRINIISFLSR